MTRHFLGLYLLIVATLAVSSWGEDRVLSTYGRSDPPQIDTQIWRRSDITGDETLGKLAKGQTVSLQESTHQSWTLKQIDNDHVLALRTNDIDSPRGPVDWLLTVAFYALIALVLMAWIWPLTRDLRLLERAVARFGDRNWRFEAPIRTRSQVYPLARTFQKMAARIDGLIASHKDMSNAVSHEIKTPLSRMEFDLELARQAGCGEALLRSLDNIEADIGQMNALVSATLSYAILERAEMALNSGAHNFTTLLPAILESVARGSRPGLNLRSRVDPGATHVICDAHLIETVIKNLLSNAARYAREEVCVSFIVDAGRNQLIVDDDGPGISPPDRQRVFTSFVQLEQSAKTKTGFGLGLAIVERAIEWHQGDVSAQDSPLGGARIVASWPVRHSGVGRKIS